MPELDSQFKLATVDTVSEHLWNLSLLYQSRRDQRFDRPPILMILDGNLRFCCDPSFSLPVFSMACVLQAEGELGVNLFPRSVLASHANNGDPELEFIRSSPLEFQTLESRGIHLIVGIVFESTPAQY